MDASTYYTEPDSVSLEVSASPVATSVEQPTGHPTEKLWASGTTGAFTLALFQMLQDYGITVKAGTQGFVTLVVSLLAGYFMKNREPSGF